MIRTSGDQKLSGNLMFGQALLNNCNKVGKKIGIYQVTNLRMP